jgi:Tol biopolymer transport system component
MAETSARLTAALAGRYRIERELGAGGMATVFLAHDERHDRNVAIKVLHEDLGATLGPERFLAEIKTTAKLQHPHILPLLDSGAAGGLLYYVMPYVEGESLRDRLEREKQLPIDDAVRIAREIADAVGAAHALGIIHRDIKPENILLRGGHALVADFGIALAVQTAGAGRMTQTGLSLGTPQYMAPEQAMGEKSVDARADIYSLGAVTYEMLIGEPPFTGATVQAIVAKVINSEPEPPTTMRKTIPPHVESAVLHALAKLPADRPATAADFVSALGATGQYRATVSGARTAAPAHRSRRGIAAGLVIGLVLGIAIGKAALQDRSATSGVSRSYLRQPKEEALPYGTTDFVISPDGEQLVYVGPGETSLSTQLWRKRRADLHAERIPNTEGGHSAFFSPDGEWLAFRQADKVLKLKLSGGAPVTLASEVGVLPLRGAWLDDGRLVTGGGSTIFLIPPEGGSKEVIVSASRGAFAGYNPEFVVALPGSKQVLVHACPVNCARNSLYVVDIAAKKDRLLLADARSPAYLPSGHLLYSQINGTLMAAPFDAAKAEITGPAIPVLEHVGSQVVISSNGTLVYREGEFGVASRLVWVDRTGRATPFDTLGLSQITSARATPDGRRVILSSVNNTSQDLWLRDASGVQTRFTTDSGAHFRPIFSPDSRTVFYVRGDAKFSMMRRPMDGSSPPRALPTGGVQIVEAAISPDGKAMVLRAGGAGGRRQVLGYFPDKDTVARVLSTADHTRMGFSFSPDGKFVTYAAFDRSNSDVFVSPFPEIDSAKWQVTPQGGVAPYWSADGKEIFYTNPKGDLMVAKVGMDGGFHVSSHERLFSTLEYVFDSGYQMYQPMPGGQRLLMMRREPFAGELVIVDNWLTELRERLKK